MKAFKMTGGQLVILSLLSACTVYAQAPNTLAPTHHNQRTMSVNGTWFIVPIDSNKVAQAVGKYPLGPVPRQDKTLFPHGFPQNKHPVLCSTSYENDIRRGNLEIDSLMAGSVLVPYVDRLGDGSPFLWSVASFIGGTNGQDLMGVVPAAVGSINTYPLQPGKFYPDNAAYQAIGDGTSFSSQIKKVFLSNPVTGPGIVPSAMDLLFQTTAKPLYTARAFHTMINQPGILQNAQSNCQRNVLFFNETFTNPIMRTGQVTLYPRAVADVIAGTYKNVGGYSAAGEQLGYNSQSCKAAAKAAKKHMARLRL